MQLMSSTCSDVLLRCICAALHAMKAGHGSEQPDLMWESAQLSAGAAPPEVPHDLNYPVTQWETQVRICSSYGR